MVPSYQKSNLLSNGDKHDVFSSTPLSLIFVFFVWNFKV